MNRFKIYDLRFTIFLLFFVLFLNHESSLINHVHAAESSPSSEIRTKLEELKREIASKAAKLKQEVNRKLQNKAYVGYVKSKSSASLTLAQTTGAKLVSINQDTVFEGQIKTKKKFSQKTFFSQKTLSEEDFVAALGDVDETGVLTAKKVVLLQPVTSNLKAFLWGQVVSISDELITLKDRTLKNIAVSKTSGTNVKLNDFIIATGTKNEQSSSSSKNDIFEAQFLYVIPQGGILKPKRVVYPTPTGAGATPSATNR